MTAIGEIFYRQLMAESADRTIQMAAGATSVGSIPSKANQTALAAMEPKLPRATASAPDRDGQESIRNALVRCLPAIGPTGNGWQTLSTGTRGPLVHSRKSNFTARTLAFPVCIRRPIQRCVDPFVQRVYS